MVRQRQVRSITISPRRYRDAKTGDWKDLVTEIENPVRLMHDIVQGGRLKLVAPHADMFAADFFRRHR